MSPQCGDRFDLRALHRVEFDLSAAHQIEFDLRALHPCYIPHAAEINNIFCINGSPGVQINTYVLRKYMHVRLHMCTYM